MLVVSMLIASVLLLSLLVQRLNSLQITQVLRVIGDKGREVIRETYQAVADTASRKGSDAGFSRRSGAFSLSITYQGPPCAVTRIEIDGLVRQAQQADCTIVVDCAVGDTLLVDARLLRFSNARSKLDETKLRKCIHVGDQRTFEQDPKYAVRLLVDIAVKALSPAITIRRPLFRPSLRLRACWCGSQNATLRRPAPSTTTAPCGSSSRCQAGAITSHSRSMKFASMARIQSR
jgi:uncharacterized membrane protein